MDIQLAKEDIIRRFLQIDDESLILAISNLLDYALKDELDTELANSIEKGLNQSEAGEVKPHSQVMEEMRKKYSK